MLDGVGGPSSDGSAGPKVLNPSHSTSRDGMTRGGDEDETVEFPGAVDA